MKRSHHELLAWQEGIAFVEAEAQLEIVGRLGYLSDRDKVWDQMEKLFALMGGLINSLKKRGDSL